jgi:hypothetical protein
MILLSHFVGVFVKYQTSDAMVTASSSIYVTKFQFISICCFNVTHCSAIQRDIS